ncbi:hypothetical protein NLJ89_g8499 [Agrocybe chaxingu]|uniref:FAD-binding domain-containing protein n=1 Tax=Agrocybe chaxingu TaxID=84603 RepID=A0A9W8MS39_9AGAR|nr:hypothetical protein NLJ89_g8499 [Agrocybe chaxingu]
MASTTKDFNVAIVGGGMCGLACAVALSRAGIDVHVFEAVSKFGEVGAAVGLGPNAIRALKGLSLFDFILKAANEPSENIRLLRYITGTGNHEHIHEKQNKGIDGVPDGKSGLGIYRPAFLAALEPLLDPCTTHFNKRCVSVSPTSSGRNALRFADETTFEADLVIGADGIRSTIRKAVVGEGDDRLQWTSTYAYRGLVSMEDLDTAAMKVDIGASPLNWVGNGKASLHSVHVHLITLAIKNGTVLNVAAFISTPQGVKLAPEQPQPWVEITPQQELLDGFQGWGDDALAVLKLMKAPSRWAIHTLYPPLKTFVSGKVVLVGDAAHSMVPHLAAGVGQGFEDVYALWRLLTHPLTTTGNLAKVLAVYDALRPSRANMILERSINAGNTWDGFGEGRYSKEEIAAKMPDLWGSVWSYDIVANLDAEIGRMESENFFSTS